MEEEQNSWHVVWVVAGKVIWMGVQVSEVVIHIVHISITFLFVEYIANYIIL